MGRHTEITDEQCDGVCCSDFVNLPDPQNDSEWKFNLTNPISPLFARDKFHHSDGKTFSPVSQATYNKVMPALRLASRMLSDDRAVQYVCTMHDGTLHNGDHVESPALAWPEIDADEPPFDEADISRLPQAQLTRWPLKTLSSADHMRKRSAEILGKLAGVLTCIVFVKDEGENMSGMTGLLLSNQSFGQLDDSTRQNFPRSMATRVTLSASFAQVEMAEPTPTSRYRLARVLVHEIAHVLNKAVHGRRRHEVFYQDSYTSEAGFELENALFGGACEEYDLHKCIGLFAKRTPVMVTEHWPSVRIYIEYRGKEHDFARRNELANFVTVSRLTPDFLAQQCDDAYWNERERRSLLSLTLSNELVAFHDPHIWVVGVGESNEVDFLAYERDYEALPPPVLQLYMNIYSDKHARLKRGQNSIIREEADGGKARESPQKIKGKPSPKQAGDWRSQKLPSAV